MFSPEDEHWFECPYCAEEISAPIDYAGGAKQAFTIDCEICCRPIAIRFRIGSDGVSGFQAERES